MKLAGEVKPSEVECKNPSVPSRATHPSPVSATRTDPWQSLIRVMELWLEQEKWSSVLYVESYFVEHVRKWRRKCRERKAKQQKQRRKPWIKDSVSLETEIRIPSCFHWFEEEIPSDFHKIWDKKMRVFIFQVIGETKIPDKWWGLDRHWRGIKIKRFEFYK